MKRLSPLDRLARFESKIRRGASPDDCWEWTAKPNFSGYGDFWTGERTVRAHRVSYELYVGPIPAGLQLDHLCRNRICVNPAHLEPVTSRENTMRGLGPAAAKARQTHCIHGHEFTPENTRISKLGQRQCRACARTHSAKYEAKRAPRKHIASALNVAGGAAPAASCPPATTSSEVRLVALAAAQPCLRALQERRLR